MLLFGSTEARYMARSTTHGDGARVMCYDGGGIDGAVAVCVFGVVMASAAEIHTHIHRDTRGATTNGDRFALIG